MASKAKAPTARASTRTKTTTSNVPTTTRTTRATAKANPKAQPFTALPTPKRTAVRKPLLNRANSTEPPERPVGKKPAGATKAPVSRVATATGLTDDIDREPIKVAKCLYRIIPRSPLSAGLPPHPPSTGRWRTHVRAVPWPSFRHCSADGRSGCLFLPCFIRLHVLPHISARDTASRVLQQDHPAARARSPGRPEWTYLHVWCDQLW